MHEYQLIVLLNLVLGSALVWWVWRSQYEGNRTVIYFLCLLLPVPTLVYLLILNRFTDQLKKRKYL